MGTRAGLTKYIETPEKLWEYFVAFMEWIVDNPYEVEDWVGKDAMRVTRKKQRPITFIGFEKWLALEGVVSDLSSYTKNDGGRYEQYIPILTRIRAICHGDITEGAAAGVFNSMIAARVAGLKDQSDITSGGNAVPFVLTLTESNETNSETN